MKKPTIKQLENQIFDARNKIRLMEDSEAEKVHVPKLKKMVGKCYIYVDNSYGGTDLGKRWNVYKRILEWYKTKDGNYYFITEEFSIDCYGEITWEIGSHHPYMNREWWGVEVPFSGYSKLAVEVYESEKSKMISEMESRTKMKKYLQTS